MSIWRVLWSMGLCRHTGFSTPECSCRQCCHALLWRHAPALLDLGPLDLPCQMAGGATEPFESYATAQGASEHELWLRSSQIEARA